MPGSYTPPPVAGGGGDSRTVLYATSDRTSGLYDPSASSQFDNLDASIVSLEISEPGNWLVGWEGLVRADGDPALFAAIVVSAPATDPDPLNNGVNIGKYSQELSIADDSWVQAISAITVTDPIQIGAYTYALAGAVQAHVISDPASPRLFAWPI